MKDTQVKPSPVAVMPKSKLGVKKEKMPAKKVKDPKLSTTKLNKVSKNKVKCVDKKSKIVKDNKEAPVKRKRGRPRKEDKVQIKKKSPEQQKTNKKNCDEKPVGCKRKLPQNNHTKNEKDVVHPPIKKPKIANDVNCNINGNVKIPFSPVHKAYIQKGESPTVIEHIVSNNVNSNGTLHGKKSITFSSKKPVISSVIKSATFIPPAKKEMVNGNSSPKAVKVHPNKNEKNVSKEESKVIHEPKISDKDVKSEKPNNSVTAIKEPVKSHPQRMASLDAMAKMHVICATDRKPVEHHPKTTTVVTVCPPFSHQKSLTCHERIHVDVKKESKDFKGNFVHKQINYVKEKQQVFVSHSVEQSSVLEREQQSKGSPKSQNEREKKKKIKASNKACVDNDLGKSVKAKPNPIQLLQSFPKAEKCKSKISKTKDTEKKCAKIQNKAPSKAVKKFIKNVKPELKVNNNKTKKIEQTKSEVKVKETIRMQKTCTYKSVTTVNSHGTSNSSVVPVSHVGMTTNTFSKTKKTVVTDEECKNKINYTSGSVINNSYCLTSESPCAIGPHSDCCKFRAHPQIIPIAHVKSCPINHNLNRTSDSSSSSSPSHCDGSFAVHRFSHQQPFIYSSPSSDCGCCCSSSLVQNVHDSCLLRKSIVAYPHHLPHHTHLPTSAFTAETLCTDYHSNNASLDTSRHHSQHFGLPSSPHSRVSCCACCDIHRENNQHHHQSSGNCLQCLSSPKNSASLVPCEQSPLDLSLASTSSSNGLDSDLSFQQGHCPSPLCCREVFVLRTSTPHGFQHSKFTPNKPCCRCNKPVACENPNTEAVKQLQCSNKNIIKIGQSHQSVDHLNLLASTVGQGSVHPVPSTSGLSNKSAPRVITESFVAAKREKSISPKQPSKVPLVTKKRQFLHGWSWKGKPRERLIALTNDSVPCPRICYPCVQHKEGDTINEKDCVLLKSGPKDTDLPYVAKVAAFWENPEDGEMMMSLLWYYRPEHTEQGRKPGQMEDEVFASRHKDVNSVACIEDKCYVLTYNEYCRYRASLTMEDDMFSKSSMLVPELPDGYPRKDRLPSDAVSSDIVFFCRHVYDFRQKRILKNPT